MMFLYLFGSSCRYILSWFIKLVVTLHLWELIHVNLMPVSVWLIVLITDTHWSGVSTSSSETYFSGSGTKSDLSFHCYGRICLSLLCYLFRARSFLNTFPDPPQSLLFGCLEWIWATFLLSRCKKNVQWSSFSIVVYPVPFLASFLALAFALWPPVLENQALV